MNRQQQQQGEYKMEGVNLVKKLLRCVILLLATVITAC